MIPRSRYCAVGKSLSARGEDVSDGILSTTIGRALMNYGKNFRVDKLRENRLSSPYQKLEDSVTFIATFTDLA